MIRNSLKLSHGTFDYYLLQIGLDTQLEEIKNKFLHFGKFEEHNKNIILDFNDKFESEHLSALIVDINNLALTYGITIHSIAGNKAVSTESVSGIPVINLPKTFKTEHIYNNTLIIDDPVRSGIKIENDGDIIITSFVSDNAEIVASGNIHVYGDARGRLIAGASGNRNARIFVQSFHPELIAIGGIYRTLENELPGNIMRKSVMVSLDDKDRLSFVPLK